MPLPPLLPFSLSAQVIRDVLLLGHRQAFAWVDEWIGKFFRDGGVDVLMKQVDFFVCADTDSF